MKRLLGLVSSIFMVAILSSCVVGELEPVSGSGVESDVEMSSAGYYDGGSTDVMMQVFKWQSKWSGQHGAWYDGLSGMASDIDSAGFTVLWFPPASKTIRYDIGEYGDSNSACGYMPLDYKDVGEYRQWVYDSVNGWYQHAGSETLYGSRTELQSAISNFHTYGIKVLADVVLNHRGGRQMNSQSEWNKWGDGTGQVSSGFAVWGLNTDNPGQITSSDGGAGTDDGEDGEWGQDLAYYANSSLRNEIKSYLYWLKNTIGFDGFRYDYVKGFDGYNVELFNNYTSPYISVGEYWDSSSRQNIVDWIDSTGDTDAEKSMAFDFKTKGILDMSQGNNDYSGLKDSQGKPGGVIGWWAEKSVTFVENHDTYRMEPVPDGPDSGSDNYNERLRCYAYILTHPGIPCVFWDDWADSGSSMKSAINAMIAARDAGDVTSTSSVYIDRAEQNLYAAYVGPSLNEQLAVKLGSTSWSPSGSGWTLATSGEDYAIWTR